MAGMLPGVESARRRRLHQGGSRQPPFRLHQGAGFPKIGSFSKEIHGGELGDVAREDKERLDGRLRTQRCAEIKRHNSEILRGSTIFDNLQREVFSLKKGGRKLDWGKLGWRASEQRECVICLESFRAGEVLMHLPCSHRFHWNCAMSWLERASQCPCCRTAVSSSSSSYSK